MSSLETVSAATPRSTPRPAPVADALQPPGVADIEMSTTPFRVRQGIRAAQDGG